MVAINKAKLSSNYYNNFDSFLAANQDPMEENKAKVTDKISEESKSRKNSGDSTKKKALIETKE